MFAPVVTRFDTYDIRVSTESRAYMDAVLATPAFQAWKQAALARDLDNPQRRHRLDDQFLSRKVTFILTRHSAILPFLTVALMSCTQTPST